ncbi:MAG TPA: hypothetical protein VE737_05820, partial [Actinomycetota bacterium]|nr:hypothetical protein [Actinomycetota bacterium]
MPNHVHTHGDAPPHEHADATPGHTHDASGNVMAGTDSRGFGTAPPAGTTAAGTTAAGTTAAGATAASHTHPGMGEHTHADPTPGHDHDEARREEVVVGPSGGGMAARILFTLLGAAGLIAGAFLSWAFGDAGVNVENQVFYSTNVQGEASLVTSAGAIVILLGILALLGLVFRTGWLTTLAGVLGIVAFALVLITIFRVDGGVADVDLGLWLVLAGGVLAVIGG